MGFDFENYDLPTVDENDDALRNERESFFSALEKATRVQPESDTLNKDPTGTTGIKNDILFDFYHKKYSASHSNSLQRTSGVQWSSLGSVKTVLDEMGVCLANFGSAIDSIEKEEKAMVSELLGLDEHSSRLLSEQDALEKQVSELEAKMRAVRALKEADEVVNNRDIILRNFDVFERAVTDVSESLRYILVSPPSEPFVVTLHRQLEHLQSRLCSITVNVATSVIDLYFRKVSQYMSTSQSAVSVSQLYSSKFGDTLLVVVRICGLFRSLNSSDFSRAVGEIEKLFCECRSRIILPIVNAYMRSHSTTLELPNFVRKSVDFVNGLLTQESVFFTTYLGLAPDTTPSESLQSLLRSMTTALYGPLRSVVIHATEPAQLKEAAEIIRVEIFLMKNTPNEGSISPYVSSAVLKLHKDIQERLIYRVESFIRDGIKSKHDATSPLERTLDCLALISGVIDGETFTELSTEAMNACIDALVSGSGGSQISEEKILEPIAQLLQLREKITEIDCMSSAVPDHDDDPAAASVSAAIRRLVNPRNLPSVPNKLSSSFVRTRIEVELKKLCEEFNATVIANVMTRERAELDKYFRDLRALIGSKFETSGFQDVLIGPVISELREGGILDDPEEVILIIERTKQA